jgi:imidazolonepropionase-like amidohydrolase
VAAGQRADLVLLDANPLTDVRNFSRRAGVMVNGRWLPESEIQQRLSQIATQFGAN